MATGNTFGTPSPNSKPKPRLSFWQIWNMSFGFLGIQFGFALQNANVSRIFETLEADVEDIPILWVAAPLTGLVVQPIIGYMSDRTWSPKWGRRRPYFLVGAIIATAALFIMPNSPVLWMAVGMLWIMDASINVTMEPFRAFVGDNLPDEQRTTGFAMQTFFIGIGAFIASALPWIFTNWLDVANTAPRGIIPDSVKWSFYLGGAVFLLAVLWTVFNSHEYSPEEIAEFEGIDPHAEEEEDPIIRENTIKNLMIYGIGFAAVGAISTFIFFKYGLKKDLYILSIGLLVTGLLFLLARSLKIKGNKNGFIEIMGDLLNMPQTMRELALVQFFAWFSLFSMWIYTTAGVTSEIYGSSDPTSVEYNDGADWVGWCFAIYNAVAAAMAFLLPILAKATSRKFTLFITLVCGAIGLGSIFFIKTPMLLLASMVGIGIVWAGILSMPYAILTGALPAHKMGYYMGVFNFFIVIPQLMAAAVLGFLIGHFFNGEAIYAMLIGGISFLIAAFLALRVTDEKG